MTRLMNIGTKQYVTCRRTYLTGMPHLSYGSLSENWLLKECGDKHWRLLAKAHNLDIPKFEDASNNTVYAAFLGVCIRNAKLEFVREHDKFEISSSLSRISGTQFASKHRVGLGSSLVGEIEMLSVFVTRRNGKDNHSVAKVAAQQKSLMPIHLGNWCDLRVRADMLRTGTGLWSIAGFDSESRHQSKIYSAYPSPSCDFNGADFLYFASFQAFVDRAEWTWGLSSGHVANTAERHLFYHGNINVGDRLDVLLCGFEKEEDRVRYWCELRRGSDGKKIADIFSIKRMN